jgi:hypothetical protein
MDTHCFAFAARRWIASALVAGVTLVGSLGFSSVASAAEPGVGAPHEQVERVARHHEHRHGERRGWGERHRGEHGRKHGGERRGHDEHRR